MKLVTLNQVKDLEELLNELCVLDDKGIIISGLTYGRTISHEELTFDEAQSLLDTLRNLDHKELIKRVAFSLTGLLGALGTHYKDMSKEQLKESVVNHYAQLKRYSQVYPDDVAELTCAELTKIIEGLIPNLEEDI